MRTISSDFFRDLKGSNIAVITCEEETTKRLGTGDIVATSPFYDLGEGVLMDYWHKKKYGFRLSKKFPSRTLPVEVITTVKNVSDISSLFYHPVEDEERLVKEVYDADRQRFIIGEDSCDIYFCIETEVTDEQVRLGRNVMQRLKNVLLIKDPYYATKKHLPVLGEGWMINDNLDQRSMYGIDYFTEALIRMDDVEKASHPRFDAWDIALNLMGRVRGTNAYMQAKKGDKMNGLKLVSDNGSVE